MIVCIAHGVRRDASTVENVAFPIGGSMDMIVLCCHVIPLGFGLSLD